MAHPTPRRGGRRVTVIRPDQLQRMSPHWRILPNLVIAALVGLSAGPLWGVGWAGLAIIMGAGKPRGTK